MKVYLVRVTTQSREYESLDGFPTKLTFPRDSDVYPTIEEIPKILVIDYWEVFDE